MSGWMKLLTDALAPDFGTVKAPSVSRLLVSRCVPIARFGTASDTKSGLPRVGFSKCVYLKVTKLLPLAIHEPSAVKMFCHDSLPVPAVGAVAERNWLPVSRRCESR